MEQQAQSALRLLAKKYLPDWQRWHNAGFTTELMPIIPIDAKLSPNSTVQVANLGKCPGITRDNEFWVGLGGKWAEKLFPTEKRLKEWSRMGAYIGVQARRLNGGDIDVNDETIAAAIERIVRDICGRAPVRTRDGSPRRLLMYLVAEGVVQRKWRIVFRDDKGVEHAFEWLGYGQYYNCDGLHPTGVPYKWDKQPRMSELTVVTQDQIKDVRNRILEYIDMMGFTLVNQKSASASNAEAKVLDDPNMHAPSPQMVLDALKVWKNTAENNPMHDDFVLALRAVKASLGPDREQYYGDVEQWAMEFEDNDEAYVAKTWNSIDDSTVGWSWLVSRAEKAGYDGQVQHDFADPPYDPKSFFELKADDVRARSADLAMLKAGWLPAYEEVRAELDKRSTISATELDALISERGATDDTEPRSKRPGFLLLDELDGLAEPSDFVEGLLCDGQSSVFYGDTNVGKSFLALDLGMHVALGRKWFGRQVERGGVVYVAGEGGGGMKRRVAAFLRRHGIEQTEGIPFALIPNMIDFRDKHSVKGFIETLHEVRARLGVPLRWIVVDTLSRALAGGNENAPDDMGALVRSADEVRSATGAHLSFLHHTGKDDTKGARGHSLLKAAVDTEIEIRRHDETKGVVKAAVSKQRDLEIGAGFAFRLAEVELGTDAREKRITSCVIEAATIKPVLDEAEQEAIQILQTMLLENEAAAIQIADWRTAIMSRENLLTGQTRDTKKRQWQRLRDSLKKKGIIETSEDQAWLKHQ